MRTLSLVALFVGLGACYSSSQQAGTSTPPKPDSQPARVKVYTVGPDVTAPELLPYHMTNIFTGKCKKKVDGKVDLFVIVDMKGRARNLSLFHTNEKELDPLAFQIVDADRFNPGTYGGSPVLVAVSVEVDLQACIVKSGDTAGNNATYLQLRSQPMQKINAFSLSHPLERDVLADVNSFWMGSTDSDNAAAPTVRVGGSVTAPVPLNNVEAAYSDVARSAKCQGNVVLSLIVDAHGMPQNIRIIKKLGYGLDEKAIEAVSKYRFKPAMKNGQPVPVMIDVEVNFHLD